MKVNMEPEQILILLFMIFAFPAAWLVIFISTKFNIDVSKVAMAAGIVLGLLIVTIRTVLEKGL